MKKSIALIFLLCILLLSSNLNAANASGYDGVYRRILTDIRWNANVPQIELDYVVIQKPKGQAVSHYNTTDIIQADSFKKGPWDLANIRRFIETHNNDTVYHSDYVFDRKLDLFRDLSKRGGDRDELAQAIRDAELSAEKDYAAYLAGTYEKSPNKEPLMKYAPAAGIVAILLFAAWAIRRRIKRA